MKRKSISGCLMWKRKKGVNACKMDCDQNDLTKHSNYIETQTLPFILNEPSQNAVDDDLLS